MIRKWTVNAWVIFTIKTDRSGLRAFGASWFSKPILLQWCRRHPFPGHSELDIWSPKNTDKLKYHQSAATFRHWPWLTVKSLVNKGTLLERFHGASSSSMEEVSENFQKRNVVARRTACNFLRVLVVFGEFFGMSCICWGVCVCVCEVKVLDDSPVKLYLKMIKKVYSWFLTVSLWPFFTHQVSKNPSYFSAKSTWKWIYFTAQQKKTDDMSKHRKMVFQSDSYPFIFQDPNSFKQNIQQEPCFGMVGFRGELSMQKLQR